MPKNSTSGRHDRNSYWVVKQKAYSTPESIHFRFNLCLEQMLCCLRRCCYADKIHLKTEHKLARADNR